MALTEAQKTAAIVILDAEIPQKQNTVNGQYVQVVQYDVDGIHSVGLHQYLGPNGIGFVRFVERDDIGGTPWQYYTHTGPEEHRSHDEWVDVTPEEL